MEEQSPELKTVNSATGGFAFTANVILFIVLALVFSLIKGAASDADSDLILYLNYLVAPVCIAASVALTLKCRKVAFRSVFPVKCSPKYYLTAILLIFGLLFSLGWINDVTLKLIKLVSPDYKQVENYLPDLTGAKIIPALLVIAVLPALFEEAMFRGVILNCCERSMGSVRTVFVVGFCFSLFHASPEQTVYQFICGCAFALMAIRSGSVLPSVIMHFINNALIIIFNACNLFDESGNLLISQGGSIAILILSALSLIAAVSLLILDKKPLKKCEKGGVKSFFIYASIGIAALAVLWICSLLGAG